MKRSLGMILCIALACASHAVARQSAAARASTPTSAVGLGVASPRAVDGRVIFAPGDLRGREVAALVDAQARLRAAAPSWGGRLAALQIEGLKTRRMYQRSLDLDMLSQVVADGVARLQRALDRRA